MAIQKIWLSKWCPHNCEFCYNGRKPFEELKIPLIKSNYVQILDPAFLSKNNIIQVMNELGDIRVNDKVVRYELVQGINYRDLNQNIANSLKENRFKKIRFAWDREYNKHYMFQIYDTIKMLKKAGYKSNDLMCYMLINWKISYDDCVKKLDLLKVWNVKVGDCCWDGQTSPNYKPKHWNIKELRSFRMLCRRHNQIVKFGIDPEVREREGIYFPSESLSGEFNRNLMDFSEEKSQIEPSA
jgi:hypothetical protein